MVSPHVIPGNMNIQFYWSPIKIFEYMAMGRPIIASDIGQISDVLNDGQDSILIQQGDEEALADAIYKLSMDENLRIRFGAAGLAKVHDEGRVVDGVLEWFFPAPVERAQLPSEVPPGIQAEYREAEWQHRSSGAGRDSQEAMTR